MSLCRSRASDHRPWLRAVCQLSDGAGAVHPAGNLMGLIPGLESPTANAVVPLGFALVTFLYYHYHGIRANGFALHQAVPRAGVVAVSAAAADRDHLALCARAFADGPSLREYVCRRPGDAGVLLAGPDWNSAGLSWAALWRGYRAGVCVLPAGGDLSVAGGGARPLELRIAQAKVLSYQVCCGGASSSRYATTPHSVRVPAR